MKGLFSKKIVLALALTVLVGGSFLVPETVKGQTLYEECMDLVRQGQQVQEICNNLEGRPLTQEEQLIQQNASTGSGALSQFVDLAADSLLLPFGAVSLAILQIANLLVWIAGAMLNFVTWHTVVNMKEMLEGIGTINTAWGAIRDIANMGFIFILLYAAIKTILGLGNNNKELIRNIIIVAVLINFSLFLTRLVIDTSNILAIFFYDAIAPGSLEATVSGGISGGLMEHLGLQTMMEVVGGLEGKKMLIVGVLGTVFSLVAAFVLFAIAIMFVIRFVVLIFVMILSPIAFVSMVFPGLDSHAKKWREALMGQAFFAPIYFALVWVLLMVSEGLFNRDTDGSLGSIIAGRVGDSGEYVPPNIDDLWLLFNFIVMIAFLVATLMIAKDWANKASDVKDIIKKVTGFAGNATLGTVGYAGRNTIGSWANTKANDESLKQRAAEGRIGARLQLAAANKAAKSSFDIRGTALGGVLDAGKVKKGASFEDEQKARVKSYERYKPDSGSLKDADANIKKTRIELENAKKEASRRADRDISEHPELKNARETLENERARLRAMGIEDENIDSASHVINLQKRVSDEEEKHKATKTQFVVENTREQRTAYRNAQQRKAELKVRMKRMAERMEDTPHVPGFMASGKTKAEAIRKAAKGKSKADKLYEDMKKEVEEESKSETPPETPPTPPA